MIAAFQKSTNKLIEAHGWVDNPGDLIKQISKRDSININDLEERELPVEEINEIVDAQRLAALTYAQKRVKEYPSIQEQLDMLYWDKKNGTNLWQQKIEEIKEKYKKPNNV